MSQSPPPQSRLPANDVWLGWLFVSGQFALLGALLIEVWAARWPAPAQWLLGGLAVVAGGIIAVAASRRLGSELRTHPAPSAAAVLRVEGPYRFVRHPIYSALLLIAAGLTVVANTLLAFVTFGALLTLLTLKARFEERLLAARFPEYGAYARQTPRFVPRLTKSGT